MRKTKIITIDKEGRDKGKIFLITEMSATEGESWAGRALFAALNAGAEIPEEIVGAGLAGVAYLGIKAFSKVPFEAAEPLFREMMDCVQFSFKGGTRKLIEDDIEEISTRLILRKEVMKLHLDFFIDESKLTGESVPGAEPTTA